ncbi:protein kinase [Sanguibacter sp. 25GB23B1]|uniref:serine/threonine-protein kinase n=1 Tax=unclassified Sanguibacter TaxID=2645534 RepID=UPI0032AF78F6
MERIGLEPGTEIGGYSIVSPLGSGAMGVVYKAVDGGGTPVALKVLHPNFAPDAEMRRRLGREVAALQKVRHPSVAQVLDAEADSAEMFIVTELVDGPTLEVEIANGGPLDPVDLHELADQLQGALAAVHAAGVIHRDLKPSNVLISDDGPVLIDFGIAHGMEDARLTSTGFVMGTPGYLAPELIDRQDPSVASDWWGWAALLVYAATGRAPFGVRPLEAVITRARSGDPDTAGLGPLTTKALRGALCADPADRLSADEVVAVLRTAAEEGDEPEPAEDATAAVAVAPLTEVVPAGAGSPGSGLAAEPSNDGSTALIGAVGPLPPSPVEGSTVVMPVAQPADGYAPGPPPPPFIPVATVGQQPDQPWDGRPPITSTQDVPLAPLEAPGYARPVVRRRTGSVLALALPLVLAGATYPGWTFVVLLALVLVSRFVGVTHDAFHSRREHRGVRGSDGVQAVVRAPWHLVRTVVATVPSLLVAASAVVVVGGVLWWFASTDRLVLGSGDRWELTVVVGVSVVIAAVLMWFGPVTLLARYGARVTLQRVAPGWLGSLVIVLVGLVVAAYFADMIVDRHPIVWSPLQEPPSFGS